MRGNNYNCYNCSMLLVKSLSCLSIIFKRALNSSNSKFPIGYGTICTAPAGHVRTHAVQQTQRLKSTLAFLSTSASLIAPVQQTLVHLPQPTHKCSSTKAFHNQTIALKKIGGIRPPASFLQFIQSLLYLLQLLTEHLRLILQHRNLLLPGHAGHRTHANAHTHTSYRHLLLYP